MGKKKCLRKVGSAPTGTKIAYARTKKEERFSRPSRTRGKGVVGGGWRWVGGENPLAYLLKRSPEGLRGVRKKGPTSPARPREREPGTRKENGKVDHNGLFLIMARGENTLLLSGKNKDLKKEEKKK